MSHRLLDQDFDRSRIGSADELPEPFRLVVEAVAGNVMDTYGYTPTSTRLERLVSAAIAPFALWTAHRRTPKPRAHTPSVVDRAARNVHEIELAPASTAAT